VSATTVAALTSNSDCTSPRDFGCVDKDFKNHQLTLGLVGLGLAAGGTGMLVAGFVINPNPIDAIQARKLADEYNDKLRNSLGIESSIESSQRYRPPLRLTVAPLLSTSGGGLALHLSF
jgi:hypothetical protein